MPDRGLPLGAGPPSPLAIDPAAELLERPGAGAAAVLGAGRTATLPKRMFEASEGLRTTGEYDPAPAVELMETMAMGSPLAAERGALGAAGGKPPIARMTRVPDIRGMPTAEAVKIARKEPHLIPKEGGGFVGGPPSIQTMADLKKLRRAFDRFIAQNPEGGDWYERYRAAIAEVTGNNPQDNLWLSRQLALMSAGVSPEIEAGFALKESNAAIAGMPVKAARPVQHEKMMASAETGDPKKIGLGRKTGQYAGFINPDQVNPPGATGVNDFRYARQWGFPTVSGGTNQGGVGVGGLQQHRWLDYETALAVDRANKRGLGGRKDWTGEQLQAVPWVRQKGEALAEQRNKPFDEMYRKANTTFGDWLDKHTAFATHEAQPGAGTGHLPTSVGAPQPQREAFAADPRSPWMDPATGRDVAYSETRIPGTGMAMRVRPTNEMRGLYTTPEGVVETNPGWAARPLVAFDTGKVKTTAPADQALMEGVEAMRGYVDVQNAAGFHKPWLGGQAGKSNSVFIPFNRKLTEPEMIQLQKELEPMGLGDIVDTGQGVTVTRFYPDPSPMSPKGFRSVLSGANKVLGGPVTGERSAVSPGYIDYVEAWKQGVGSGAATRKLLQYVTKTPEIKAALNNNEKISQKALGNLERDEEWRAIWGAPREDIVNAQRIIGEGKGWIDRLEAALKAGAILPVTVAAVLGSAALLHQQQQGAGRAEQ